MSSRRGQRGQAIVLIALMMAVLVGFVALAIDSARAFDSRQILQDAVDNAALAAAEYYQNNPGGWSSAESTAGAEFSTDNRVYTSRSCSPGSVAPTPGAPGTALSMTCTYGTTSYQLTISAEDDGPAGQTFTLSGQTTVDLSLMQVLGQAPTITVRATGAATASDQALTPALAGLSSSGCFGTAGNSVNVSNTPSPGVTVIGDVVADGTVNIGSASYAQVAGNVLTRCAAPTDPNHHLSYYCWPGGAAPVGGVCTASNNIPGRLLSTGNHFADPGFNAPTTPASVVFSPSNVVLSPGSYATDPNFGSAGATCYFLDAGVYQWQAGLTVNKGLISNELKPPDEPVYNDNTTRSPHQFWDDNAAACGGPASGTCSLTTFTGCSISLSSGTSSGKGIEDGTWSVVVTSLRSETIGSVTYLRESAPSMCHQLAVSGSDKTLGVTVDNVPGAAHSLAGFGGYNVYAAPPPTAGGSSTCAGPFGLVAVDSIPNLTTETVPLGSSTESWNSDTLTNSPNPLWAPDVNAPADTATAYPPSSETSPWKGSSTLPNQGPARGATAGTGDRANENQCATGAGANAICPASITPGGVEMYATNGDCFNLGNTAPGFSSGTGGDAYVFSGYQYDWLLNYVPPSTTSCTNTATRANVWDGEVNSAAIGMTYSPGVAFNIQGYAGFYGYMGGIVAYSISINQVTSTPPTPLTLDFSKDFAPAPGGTRLTG